MQQGVLHAYRICPDPFGMGDVGSESVVDWIERAGDEGVDLLVIGETHLGGYPFFAVGEAPWDDPTYKRAYSDYLGAAVELDGPEMARITEAAAEHRVFVYIGIAERGAGPARGSVFSSLIAIDPQDGAVSAHRKVQVTFHERLVWAQGDGNGLRVHEITGRGGDTMRVGGLICWENWMPQARLAMYAGGEDIHVSVWPGSVELTSDITRFIAREGRVYSLAAGSLLARRDVPKAFPLRDRIEARNSWMDGGSAIAAPDGAWIREPVSRDEGLVVADIDAGRVRGERQNFDPTGHYGRPDIFQLRVDRRRHEVASFGDEPSVA